MNAKDFLKKSKLAQTLMTYHGVGIDGLVRMLESYSPSLQPISEEEIEKEISKQLTDIDDEPSAWYSGFNLGWERCVKWLLSRGVAKKSEWISVEDKLPEDDNMVLVLYKDNDVGTDDYNGKVWTNEVITSLIEVTHWQPLPKPQLKKSHKSWGGNDASEY